MHDREGFMATTYNEHGDDWGVGYKIVLLRLDPEIGNVLVVKMVMNHDI